MKIRTLNPNLIQLTRLRFVNAYLVREDDGFTLVDTTTRRRRRRPDRRGAERRRRRSAGSR